MSNEYEHELAELGLYVVPVSVKKQDVVLQEQDGDGNPVYRLAELREMMGNQRDDYMNRRKDKFKVVDDETVIIKDFKGFYSDLLLSSLYVSPLKHSTLESLLQEKKDPDAPPKEKMQATELASISTTSQKQLFEISSKLNGLTQEKKKKEGDEEETEKGEN